MLAFIACGSELSCCRLAERPEVGGFRSMPVFVGGGSVCEALVTERRSIGLEGTEGMLAG